MDRIDSSLVALRRILRATELFARDLAAEAGLTAAQLRVLQLVAEKGFSTATHISQQMKVTQATVTSLVDKLVARGVVRREKSEADRRQVNIVMTQEGMTTLAAAPDPLQQRYVRKFKAMEDWEQSLLVASLQRVAAMLDAEDIDASPVLDTRDLQS